MNTAFTDSSPVWQLGKYLDQLFYSISKVSNFPCLIDICLYIYRYRDFLKIQFRKKKLFFQPYQPEKK